MPRTLNINFAICTAGLGVCAGALGPAIDVPFVVVFAVGLGIILGGVFRAVDQIQGELNGRAPST